MITIKDVEHVALLARLELSDEEKKMYTGQLNAILEYARMLNELDTDHIPPTAHVLPLKNVWREDQVGKHMPPEEVLANAPDREGQFFKVPRIV
ncbi:Asp-tRNA(Asn)/Glu-tRNA(Gln) amidotransferase subunit GatC [Desulfofundulus thermobenzoicus]|uniref:Aspartyl/glutamyl-tRNA(Asn/Gln) amidotransferase subunit C n=1 Tax=Desulfofundulus thermobenzoicus TaxID=29376 RepID=A0A6N7IR71_9FIRM|nr:Asp-tRNA(Asn)/Glu-tRNA(Gln) amidotransferase subunit GatC [Desulfofundulus thermobenzoicus]MQL52007.1 Asp-tRNA(Asn)/Glu-tRNA(Gln) amidotransferase subunit GatC [Desulfofundulus thermobenzoicus]